MPSNHTDLKKFAQSARRSLREQVAARLDQVLRTDSAALREREAARKELSQQIAETSKKAVIDRVAYTWFNRFCALRFMDVNRYNRIGVVSPAEIFTQPEILQEAKQGYIDSDLQAFVDCPAVFDLLGGRRPSTDPQQEAYRLLLVGTCNALNKVMPFLFEPIADYTELLMPQDLLSEHSILNDLREAMTPEACQDVEVIGWLYQFYISERKDEVFEALKANQKIAPEDIPAATQLFTPHWIVRYLVENSLGRLWMLNHPKSRLVEQMDYYIKPEEQETDFLRVASPEEIKICDPACGSGHMLTYAFDLLYAIYEEAGYPSSDIPRLILEMNLYGIEIDERAGDLAAFALAMKAREKDRRFFNREVQPNICVLENISFTDQELKEYILAMGRDLLTEPLMQTLKQFEQAKSLGSLIQPVLSETSFIRAEMERKSIGSSIFLFNVHERVLKILNQAVFLSPQYHIVIANPPYMGSKGMNDALREFANDNYPKSKSDLFSMFIERGFGLLKENCYLAMVTMESWMFLSSFEKMRTELLKKKTIISMVHMPYLGKGGTSMGISFGTSATIFKSQKIKDYRVLYSCVRYFETDENGIPYNFPVKNERLTVITAEDFLKIPASPIAYWIDKKLLTLFEKAAYVENVTISDGQNKTGDNDQYLRFIWEVSKNEVGKSKWIPYAKGGQFRKWYGNIDLFIDWSEQARSYYRKDRIARLIPEYLWYRKGITWSFINTKNMGFRYLEEGGTFDVQGSSLFFHDENIIPGVLGILNSVTAIYLLRAFNPTMSLQVKDVRGIPLPKNFDYGNSKLVEELVSISKDDWNIFETAMTYECNPLLLVNPGTAKLSSVYSVLRSMWKEKMARMQKLECENNAYIIEAYDLHGVFQPEVDNKEITINTNPVYRYGENKSEAELEALLLSDTLREFISHAVGCMFGRYSLDKPGLILANQGETLQDYLRQVTDPTFLPDEDNAIPVLDGEWFGDDITERFKKFLRVTFGTEHYEENLSFIEQAIGRDIRSYFTKEFYSHHVRMYQKRPIYWMFSSPKGSFNVLIYMHRYQPDTLSVILNRYLREFRGKLEGRKAHLEQVSISASSTQREKTAALKEIEGLNKTLEEIRVYEREILYPLAVQGIQIDLDDGVKVNYKKFGKALAKVNGLSD